MPPSPADGALGSKEVDTGEDPAAQRPAQAAPAEAVSTLVLVPLQRLLEDPQLRTDFLAENPDVVDVNCAVCTGPCWTCERTLSGLSQRPAVYVCTCCARHCARLWEEVVRHAYVQGARALQETLRGAGDRN